MTTTTAETNAPEIIEGEIVDATTGPQAGQENSSGEVAVRDTTDAQPVEKSDLTRKQAESLTKKLKGHLSTSVELIMEAYTKRIWLALDFESWAEYLHVELGEQRVRLPQTERRQLAGRMKAEAKMSQSAIADALGWDQKTISNDLKQLREDGGSAVADGPVVGQDGKSYNTAPAPRRAPRLKPIEDRFTATITKVDQLVGDLVALSAEDGFTEAAGAVAKAHRADVFRLIDSLKGVQERLQ